MKKSATAVVEKEFISIKDASRLTGIQPQTLRKMGDSGKINCYKTASGQRKFHRASLTAMCFAGGVPHVSTAARENFIYCRAASRRDLDDAEKQYMDLVSTDTEKYSQYHKIVDISAGGDLKRAGLTKILQACINKTVGEIIVASKSVFGLIIYDFLEELVKLAGGKIIIITPAAPAVADVTNMFDSMVCLNRPEPIIPELISMLQSLTC